MMDIDQTLLLDTSIVIDFLRNDERAIQFIVQAARGGHLVTHPIVVAECYHGARNKTGEDRVVRFLNQIPMVEVQQADFLDALAMLRQYRLSHGVGFNDCLIAATAKRLTMPVLTRDRDFALFDPVAVRRPY